MSLAGMNFRKCYATFLVTFKWPFLLLFQQLFFLNSYYLQATFFTTFSGTFSGTFFSNFIYQIFSNLFEQLFKVAGKIFWDTYWLYSEYPKILTCTSLCSHQFHIFIDLRIKVRNSGYGMAITFIILMLCGNTLKQLCWQWIDLLTTSDFLSWGKALLLSEF